MVQLNFKQKYENESMVPFIMKVLEDKLDELNKKEVTDLFGSERRYQK